ncbi:AHH domain-containing protein [Archangium violaceum]|uniref:AHH domain-containing protein n=1 Tax=Archangium violaceum TaxID=83451 RepID=UPI0037BEFB1E
MAGNHVKKDDFKALHQPKEGEGGKGCIWSWNTKYEVGHQCSYRWQAREHALADSHLYNFPAYKSLCVDHAPGPSDVFVTAAYRGPKSVAPSNNYALRNNFPYKKRPRPGQWDVTLSRNFTESWTRPYWHNAHHIIPRSVLHDELIEAGKEDPRITDMIIQGLLKAGYNLNDKKNLIILPMDRAVATSLGLPRHLLGDEAEAHEPLQGRQIADHPDYSRRLRFMLRPVINQYKRLVKQKLSEAHPAPPDALAKEQVERISETVYKAITKAGPFMKGKSLDELRFAGLGGR